MTSSHAPSLSTLVRRAVAGECQLEGQRLLVAVSGGPDSMALLHALARCRDRHRLELYAHGVDHGLRPEAEQELGLAEDLARRWDVPFERTRGVLAPGGNLQARARALRHEHLERRRQQLGGAIVVTGHHADDRAETLLSRMLRGAGPRGLAVLPPRQGHFARPLLRARRQDVLLHLTRHAIPYARDPSNEDPRFLRTRLRAELLPLLEQLDPRVVQHLGDLADDLVAAGPLPAPRWLTSTGEELLLTRAQQRQLERAQRRGQRHCALRLAAGRDVVVELASGDGAEEKALASFGDARASRRA